MKTKALNAPGTWMLLNGCNHSIIGKKTACGITVAEGAAKPVRMMKYNNSQPILAGPTCENCQDKIVEFHCGQAKTSGSKRHVS